MDAGVYARTVESVGRAVQVGVAGGRIISVSFPESVPEDAGGEHPLLDRVEASLEGTEDDLDDVEVALTLPTDLRRVLTALRSVPRGRTVSVGKLASLAGLDADDADDLETVRTALRENPVPLFVPDHRVRDAPGATPGDVAERLRDVEA